MSINHETTLSTGHPGEFISNNLQPNDLGAAAVRGINVFPAQQPPKKQQPEFKNRFGINPLHDFIREGSSNSID